jgi:hypothetical protein
MVNNRLCTLNPSKPPFNNRVKAGDNQEASISLVNNNPNKPHSQWNPHFFR